jgi:hypothetical protein
MNGTLENHLTAENIATLNRAGETYTDKSAEAIVTSHRLPGKMSDADVELWLANRLADIIAKAENFIGRIVTESVSKRRPSKGIVIVNRRDDRFGVIEFTEFTNDGRAYEASEVFDTEAEAREAANTLWVSLGY